MEQKLRYAMTFCTVIDGDGGGGGLATWDAGECARLRHRVVCSVNQNGLCDDRFRRGVGSSRIWRRACELSHHDDAVSVWAASDGASDTIQMSMCLLRYIAVQQLLRSVVH
jgi:hypothetical protein